MEGNIELQQWGDEIQEFYDWYVAILEHTQEVRERGHYAFVNDVPISIMAFNSRLENLKKLSTPKFKGCKKIKKSLEESMKQRIKQLQIEAKYFQDIQDGTLAGRLGAGGATFSLVMADELLKESLAEFHKIFRE